MLAHLIKSETEDKHLVADLIGQGELAVLVVPIDSAAPKGRLILPQQQTIREILECGSSAVVTREHELAETLKPLSKKPRLVITVPRHLKRFRRLRRRISCLPHFLFSLHGIKGI